MSAKPEGARRTGVGGKALFLDRDGTLIIDKVYLSDPAGVELIPGTAEALRRARALGYALFLFTNQSGIGRGYYTLREALAVNARLESLLGVAAPVFVDTCIAPEAPDQPMVYRKPSPRFILESIERYGLDPRHCWMVGDSAADVQAGLGAGIRSVAVRTGKVDPSGIAEVISGRATVFADLAAFVETLAHPMQGA